jgi:hypothetical protein
MAALCLATGAALAQHPNDARGFTPERAYDVHDLDTVNLFNGNLMIRVPIGPEFKTGQLSYRLALTYNSHVWKYFVETHYDPALVFADPLSSFNAGLGWRLSLGKLFESGDPDFPDPPQGWVYLGPDGSQHVFGTGQYTHDGSFLRLSRVNDWTRTVDFPDGTVHTFTRLQPQNGAWAVAAGTDYYLTEMRDAFGNHVTVSYSTDAGYAEVWTISDAARTNAVYFIDTVLGPNTFRTLHHVDTAAFGATPATYRFAFTPTTIPRGNGDSSGRGPIQVALLTSIPAAGRQSVHDGPQRSAGVRHLVNADAGRPDAPHVADARLRRLDICVRLAVGSCAEPEALARHRSSRRRRHPRQIRRIGKSGRQRRSPQQQLDVHARPRRSRDLSGHVRKRRPELSQRP